MTELKWEEAIVKVFEEEKKALHYTEIAELISERGYRRSLGATLVSFLFYFYLILFSPLLI
jgi:hypothetical protein